MPYEVKRSNRSSLNFIKIIKTNNLSDKISKRIIADLKSERSFQCRENKYSGFNESFVINPNKPCNLDFLLVNQEYGNFNEDSYDENNLNHIKLHKLNFVMESSSSFDNFIDIFFIPKFDLIVVNGSKEGSDKPINLLIKKLEEMKKSSTIYFKDSFDFNQVNLTSDFLFWLIYKRTIGENISNEIDIEVFSDFSTQDFPDENDGYIVSNIPREITTVNSDNFITLPILYGLLNDRDFSRLMGKFKYKNSSFEIRIEVIPSIECDSLIFIKSVYSLKGKSYCDKIKLVLPFINELIQVFLDWENLDATQKYPSENFINQLRVDLINEFNLTLQAYFKYKNEFNEKTNRQKENLNNIFSLNPKINIYNIDDKSLEYIEYLVNKNVLLYLQN